MKMMHLYGCESCKLDFAVSTSYPHHEKVVCPVCNTSAPMVDYKQDIKYRILRTQQESNEVELYRIFEREFGRIMSPFEVQMISEWNGKFHTDVIKLALREAIIRNVKQMKYIDRILLNWEQAGVTTVSEAIEISKRYERKVTVDRTVQTATRETIPNGLFYNWLEG